MAALALVLSAPFAARVAQADCAQPDPALVWSYPAQGETGVPTNVDLWLLTSGWGSSPTAFLDGVELSRLTFANGYELGQLQPNTSYTVSIGEPGATSGSFELGFTTGAGPAQPDPGVTPTGSSVLARSESTLSAMCKAVLATQDCFDTGQDTYYVFEPGTAAKAWLIQSSSTYRGVDLWPAECGAPQLFLHSSTRPCATLHGIDAAGATHTGEEMCTGTLGDLPGDDEGGGCSLGTPHAPASPLHAARAAAAAAALALAAAGRRRAARPS
jgi:hypothetical protein